MSRYKHILVAVDLKEEDDNPIAEQAQLLANANGAKLTILHVVEPIYTYGVAPGAGAQFDNWEEEIEASAKRALTKLGEKLNIPSDQQLLRIGSPRSSILSTANQLKADLIVVGHHGRHGLGSLIFGNTADDLVHESKCDVLAMHV